MGLLKTNGYTIAALGITLDTAYAKVSEIYLDKAGNGKAFVTIQKNREGTETLSPLETREINFVANKELPIYEQAYLAAKAGYFATWVDDIVPASPPEQLPTDPPAPVQ